ncbi:hypothetical protein RJZ56_000432 [Blastomyces dermatitidis]
MTRPTSNAAQLPVVKTARATADGLVAIAVEGLDLASVLEATITNAATTERPLLHTVAENNLLSVAWLLYVTSNGGYIKISGLSHSFVPPFGFLSSIACEGYLAVVVI